MTEYLTEQEQIEMLKNWIKQYSLVILGSVVLTGAIIFGWRYINQRKMNTLTHASMVYDEMLTMRANNDAEAAAIQAKKLNEHYANTVYSQLANFMNARTAISQKRYGDAEAELQSILKQSGIDAFRQLARIRLARVLIADQKPEQAITILNKIDDPSFNGLTNEVKGDAYLAAKQIDQAREAYRQALSDLPNADSIRPLLQMKYDNLSNKE